MDREDLSRVIEKERRVRVCVKEIERERGEGEGEGEGGESVNPKEIGGENQCASCFSVAQSTCHVCSEWNDDL